MTKPHDYGSSKLRALQAARVFCTSCGGKNRAKELATFDPVTGARRVFAVDWGCPIPHDPELLTVWQVFLPETPPAPAAPAWNADEWAAAILRET